MKTYRMKAISLLAAWILAMSGCLTPVLADGSEEEENREQYFIIYDANGGEGSIEKTAVKAGEEAARSEDNAKTGEKDGKESDPVDAQAPVIEWFCGGGAFFVGDKALLEIHASVGDGGTVSYQWYQSTDGSTAEGTAVAGAQDTLFEAPTQEAGLLYYYCVVTNTNEQADGKKTAQTVSKAVSVMVTEPRQITVDAAKPVVEWISGGGAFNQGDPAVLEIKASVEDGGTLSYQWYRSEDGSAESGTALDGATENTYHPSTDAAGTVYYYCVVTNTNEQVNGEKTAQAVSEAVQVTVQQPVPEVEKAQKPQVEGPVGGTFYESDAFVLKVKASVSDGGMLTYQWYRNKEKIEGATKAEYMPPVGTAYYYCVVININQQATLEKTAYTVSNAVEVTVKEGDRPKSAAKPEVSGPSGGGTYYKGQSPRLEVEAQASDGGTLTYQWYRSSDSSRKGTPIEDAAGAAYLPSTKDTGTVYYYCMVSNTNDEASETKTVSAASQMVKVTVIEKGTIKDEVKRVKPVSRNTKTDNKKTDSAIRKESVRRAANARTEDENQVIPLLFLTLGAGTAATALMIGRKYYR